MREEATLDGEQTAAYGPSDRSASLRVEGERVGEANGGSSNDVFAEPGTYYVSLAANDRGSNLEAEQFDSSIDLQVTGAVIPAATPTATAAPAKTAAPADQTGGLGGGGGDGGGGGASSGWRSCSASRSAGWPASASGGCGRARSAGGEVAAQRAHERAEDEHDPEHALALCVAEERVLQQRVQERERDRPDRPDQRPPGGGERGEAAAARSRATVKPANSAALSGSPTSRTSMSRKTIALAPSR